MPGATMLFDDAKYNSVLWLARQRIHSGTCAQLCCVGDAGVGYLAFRNDVVVARNYELQANVYIIGLRWPWSHNYNARHR